MARGEWLDTRRLEPRMGRPANGIVNAAFIVVLSVLLWWIFFNPKGPISLYTPLYGFSFVVWLLVVGVWQVDVFQFWPFGEGFLRSHILKKGFVLLLINIALSVAIIFIFFYGILGRYGITYFSWFGLAELMERGGIGQASFAARENASLAILYYGLVVAWFGIFWPFGFGRWPWEALKKSVRGFTMWAVTVLIGTFSFFIFFHPHMGAIFYPEQIYAAVPPWWTGFAQTKSAFFNLGWIISIITVILLSGTLWEGRPWSLIKGQPLKGLVAFFGTIVLGLVFFWISIAVMNWWWGEAYLGGQYTDAPYYRYLHVGETATFILIPALVLSFYFGNLPRRFGLWVNATARTLIVIGVGLVFMWAYYELSPILLGTVPGIAQPEETPLCWQLLVVNLIIYHNRFFDNWPGDRRVEGMQGMSS
jgi:AAT family amino acid transporter